MNVKQEIGKYKVTLTNCTKALTFVPTEEDPLPNLTNMTVSHSYQTHNEPSAIYLLNLQNLIRAHLIMMYEGNCFYPIRTPPNQLYPSKQPYLLIIPQQIT